MVSPDLDGWRTRPMYTVRQAAKFAKVHPTTIRRWLHGYKAPEYGMQPVFGPGLPKTEQPTEISFLMLAEILVVLRFRKKGVTLERLRHAHDYAKRNLGIEHPFASLKLKTDGVHIFQEFEREEPGPHLLSLDKGGQWALPGPVVQLIEEFGFESDLLVARWSPAGRDVPIVVDPLYAAGKPTIRSRGVTIETIYKMFRSGYDIEFIASDFDLDPKIIQSALRHAPGLAA